MYFKNSQENSPEFAYDLENNGENIEPTQAQSGLSSEDYVEMKRGRREYTLLLDLFLLISFKEILIFRMHMESMQLVGAEKKHLK